MDPVDHITTSDEKEKVRKAFSLLPPLHQKVLKAHLYSISFMDSMPNTALTSPIEGLPGSSKMFNITVRAAILKETISEWATWKENTCFIDSQDSGHEIIVDAGNLDAIVYILLHEATHVVDAVLNIASHPGGAHDPVAAIPFTAGIWSEINMPTEKATNALLETTRFRSGKPVAISLAPAIYEALRATPFASLYSMASWHEDLAEILTIYHLTQILDQPFTIWIRNRGVDVASYEPFTNKRVRERQGMLARFY
ncbi:MAG: hypothetical protein EOP49_03040 [Sphingobacteriales bacterium]|nr:MAG: hypothetical protein EOP49_03040 [Sphingobacteriales bacterium]